VDDTLQDTLRRLRNTYALGELEAARAAHAELLEEQPELEAYLAGLQARASGDHAAARRAFAVAVQQPDPPTDAGELLGWSLLELGLADEAEPLLRARMEQDPEALDAQVGLARCLFRQRRAEEGLALLEDALARDPDHFEASYGLGVTRLALGQVEEALEALKRAQTIAPMNPRPYLALVQILHATGSDGLAADLLEGAMENPVLRSSEMLLAYARQLVRAGRPEHLGDVLRKIEGGATFRVDLWLEIAGLHYALQDAKSIARLATEVLTRVDDGPARAEAFYLSGLAADLRGDEAFAEIQFKAAAQEDATHWRARSNLASMYLDRGKPEEASIWLHQSQELAGDRPEVRYNLAFHAHLSGDDETAAELLRGLVDDDEAPPSLRERARVSLDSLR
jgi:Flp pilus assembly protein TadD